MSNFMEQSQEALCNFLNTAVIIDDKIYGEDLLDEKAAPVVTPSRTQSGNSNSSTTAILTTKPYGAPLQHKELVKAFLEKEILCTLIEPEIPKDLESDFWSTTIENAFKADIIILDWKLGTTEKTTMDLIKKHTKNILNNALQLVCIYTSELDLDDITSKIKVIMPKATEPRKNILENQNTYIIVVQKSDDVFNPDKHIVNGKDLPTFLIKKFAELTSGLLANTVLNSFAAIRKNTHAVISQFSKDLDPAFITHRIYSSICDDAMHHVHPLICDEISSILTQSKIHEHLSCETLHSYCSTMQFPLTTENLKTNYSLTQDEVKVIITDGVYGGKTAFNWIPKKANILACATSKLFGGGKGSDAKFAILTTHMTDYTYHPPILRGGSIIKSIKDATDNYLLCIQPQCDSVRVPSDGYSFLFLPLIAQPEESKMDFDHIIENNGNYIYLKIKRKHAHDLVVKHFVPHKSNETSIIAQSNEEKKWYFDATVSNSPEKESFIYIAQLKEMQTQKIVNNFASILARVGLTESEWLRRCNPK